MYDEQHFTRDAAVARFDTDAPGVTVDDDGEPEFDWDEVETVTIDNPPHAEAFDSKEFYKLPATVAKPIPQPYRFGDVTDSAGTESAAQSEPIGSDDDGVTWLKKPRDELKKAAWSLENAPWTMDHPDTGMVKDVDDIRGFWRNPRYIDSMDDLDSDLYVPTNDEEAKEFIEANGDVSVGFYNRIARVDDYDGIVGGNDDEDVDIEGYQTDMLFDHCASVSVGRCPSGAGCGIESDACQLDSEGHGHIDALPFKGGTAITDKGDGNGDGSESQDTDSMQLDQSEHMNEGSWYAVPPSDNPDDEWKFPIDNCSDVGDAWQLRGHGDLSIEQSTLESRIKERARDLGCDVPGESEDALELSETPREWYDNMTEDEDCGCNDNTMEFDFDDLTAEAALAKVEAEHDGVEEHLDGLRGLEPAADAATEAAEALDTDVSELADAVSMLKEQRDELQEELEKARRPQMEEDAEFIAERTDRYGEDAEDVIENLDEDPDEVSDKRELVEDLTEGYDEQTANAGGDGASESADTSAGKYATTPWE